MAVNTKNKYPSDKSGTKYAEFRNTKRVPPSKVRADSKQSGSSADQAGKTA